MQYTNRVTVHFLQNLEPVHPHVCTQLPRTDLCSLCQSHTVTVGKMANLPAEEKAATLGKATAHLQHVSAERQEYTRQIQDARHQVNANEMKVEPHPPMNYEGCVHYSFDYAQQIFLPQNSQQVGELYFLVPMKVGWFGIMCETTNQMVHFLIPEAVHVSKGANAILSLSSCLPDPVWPWGEAGNAACR